ncbi:MAG TPA: IPT/TIG domain-containing protein [Verrucomicrobiae bacterium]|nr:IPT/TIG domain-containing protein [Verrucomicrobiae bacterium]
MHIFYSIFRKALAGLAGLSCCVGSGVLAAPTISSFSPTFGSSTDPGNITITGTGFAPGTVVVKFNGVQDPTAGATSTTTIQAHVPAGAPLGAGPIFVSVAGVGVNSADDFTVIGSGPFVSGFSPAIGNAGASVTIFGAHFSNPLTVKFNGVTVPGASTAAPDQFTVTVPAGVTTGPISVTTTAGTWTTVSNFFVPPVITSFSPASGRAGTNVLVRGTNFVGTTAVRFNGVDAASFSVLSNTVIQATVPANATTGPVRVNTPAGSAITTSNFVVLPTVTGFAPAFGPVGTSVTISGANFNVGTPTVKFNGVTAAAPTGVSFGQLTAVVPNGATTGPITVTTTDGTGTSPALFYLPPRITGFAPSNSAPGTTIKITGTNFTDASAVQFNGTPAAAFFVTNNNTLSAVVPAGFVTGPISVTAPGGTASSSSIASSNFYAAPLISGINPLHGLPGTNVTISGASFLGTTAVQFQADGGGTTNAPIVSVNNGQIVVRVPTNAVTGPITVVAPAGSDTSSSTFFLDYAGLLVTVADSPDPVMVGENLTYAIQVKNLGPNASAVTVTNVLPPGVSFVSASAGVTTSNVTVANLGTLAVDATGTLTIVATPNTAAVVLTNLTTAYSGPLPSYTPTVTTTYVEPPRLLSIAPYTPGVVLLAWPTALSNYTLQYKHTLDPNVTWADVLTTPVTNGGSNLIAEPISGSMQFYRLKR